MVGKTGPRRFFPFLLQEWCAWEIPEIALNTCFNDTHVEVNQKLLYINMYFAWFYSKTLQPKQQGNYILSSLNISGVRKCKYLGRYKNHCLVTFANSVRFFCPIKVIEILLEVWLMLFSLTFVDV